MRRARIKAVANLSAARRSAAKTNNESTEKACYLDATSSSLNLMANVPMVIAKNDDLKIAHDLNREHSQEGNQHSAPTTFKTPLQIPRNDHCGSGSSQQNADKSRRFKIAPRFNASRSVVAKSHVI